MTTPPSTPPADPETAALDLIVRIGEAVPGAVALRGALQDFAGALHVEGALAGLTTAADARLAAATIAEAACTADDSVAALRIRAAAIRAGCWDCAHPDGLAQALDGAATVLDAM
ncbi:amino acid aminotransferase [Mycobacterium paragordonae]|uniref:amino acid aminotransferase n=1 Tax=Mycobacterium paragordonae TaxID=1389713 RepID=UPI0010622A9B|nr:amino acid aminotransferase [Mycobacterium paragordonae]TDL01548.1 amino acid aminotransferase [Mycobacterium paragordonae]